MHDIDRTQLQSGTFGGQEIGYHEFESEFQEAEGEGEFEDELFYEDEAEGETYEEEAYEGEDEGEFFEAEGEAYEGEGEAYEFEEERVYEDEAWEMEMASELLAVRDEAELEQFLGNLIKGAAKGLSSLAKKAAPVLLPALKSVAKQALPFVGGALGGLAGGPVGAQLGSQLASTAGDMFGLELEGLSYEDQEFEVAKQFVRFANDAVNMLGETARHHAEPKRAAHAAVKASAQKHAPGSPARPGRKVADGPHTPGQHRPLTATDPRHRSMPAHGLPTREVPDRPSTRDLDRLIRVDPERRNTPAHDPPTRVVTARLSTLVGLGRLIPRGHLVQGLLRGRVSRDIRHLNHRPQAYRAPAMDRRGRREALLRPPRPGPRRRTARPAVGGATGTVPGK